MTLPEMRHPLPTLDQWLDRQGYTGRAEDFEAIAELARRTLALSDSGALTADELSFLRMWKGFLVAAVELSNIEAKHGRTSLQIVQTLPRVLAAAAMYSCASVFDADTPWRDLAKVMIEEFRIGANVGADQLHEASHG